MTLLAMICLGGNRDGAGYNPAVGLVQLIFESVVTNSSYYKYIWIYVLGPFIGSIFAVGLHKYHVHVHTLLKKVQKSEVSGQ